MKKSIKTVIVIILAIISIILGIGIGSVFVSPQNIGRIILFKLFDVALPENFNEIHIGMVWNLRMPRVFLAFLVGGALSVSGAVMQSVLKNPLASSYGLGVSSGAGFGVALLIVTGLAGTKFGVILMPFVGLIFALITVFLAVSFATKIDKNLSNNTIILTGMVLSLFINALMTYLASASPKYTQRIMLWQLGSFSMKEWSYILILLPILIFGVCFFMRYSRELDILTFGEEQAASMGIDLKKTKWLAIGVSAMLAGTAVSFVGVIGFIDLIAPHVVRRFFGSSHKYVIPISAFFGGTFMVICDLLARTLTSPAEIPIGTVTALFGAPFFIYIYSKNRKKG